MSTLPFWLLTAPPLLPLGLTLLNVATWSRGKARARFEGKVSILIPARNEEHNIEACVRAIAANEHPVHEIVVYDDQSSDRTRAIVEELKAEIPSLRVIAGDRKPPGWVGKPFACHRLAQIASGDLLFFVDADTRLAPEGVGRMVSLIDAAGVATAVPHQVMKSWGEALLMPLLIVTYTSWLPLLLVGRTRDPRFVAANGQLLAVRRDVYDRLGGFDSVRSEIVDDVAFCRHAKQSGETVVFGDGTRIAQCRMYDSIGAVWRGFSKNIYEGLGGKPIGLLAAFALHVATFIVPYLALLYGLFAEPALVLPAALGVMANVALRLVLAVRFRQPLWSAVAHPLAVCGLLAMAVNSLLWTRRDQLMWAGRAYPRRAIRVQEAE